MKAPVVAVGPDGVRALIGAELGHSEWLEITQERVNLFAEATGDHQWIHVDPERAAKSPFGGAIAHGYLTLSLLPTLIPQVIRFEGFTMGVNYGTEKVRFPAPVLVGSRIRAGLRVDSVSDVAAGIHVVLEATVEGEGAEKPCCVASLAIRKYV